MWRVYATHTRLRACVHEGGSVRARTRPIDVRDGSECRTQPDVCRQCERVVGTSTPDNDRGLDARGIASLLRIRAHVVVV
jgi:hypothetical protein